MPNRLDEIKSRLDRLKTKRAVVQEKIKETKVEMKRKHNVSTIKQARTLKEKLAGQAEQFEAEAEEIINEVESRLDEFDEDEE